MDIQALEDQNRLLKSIQDLETDEIAKSSAYNFYHAPLELVELFCERLKTNSSLRNLFFYEKLSKDDGSRLLSEALKVNKHLRLLSFPLNGVEDAGCVHFAEALKLNSTLMRLGLNANGIRDAGARAIATGLKANQCLIELDLAGNKIGEDGAGSLCEAFKMNNSLTYINLGKNHIGNEGARHFAELLSANSALVAIDLGWNDIGDLGIQQIAYSLMSNTRLQQLFLTRNFAEKMGSELLRLAITENSTLFHIEKPLLDEETWGNDDIEEKLKLNKKGVDDQYLNILNEHDKAPWNRSRLMFVGEGRAGKSATVRSLLGQRFDPDLKSTIGANVSESTTSRSVWIQTQRNTSHLKAFAARIALTLSSVPKEASSIQTTVAAEKQKKDSTYSQSTESKSSLLPSVKLNHTDKASDLSPDIGDFREQSTEEESKNSYNRNLIKLFDEKFLLEAKQNADSVSLSLWDFGGQDVFYSLHHIFLTKEGIYVLVFDMRELAVESESRNTAALSYLSFWLRSVRLHASNAPLLIVGTFASQVNDKNDIRNIDQHLRALMKQSFPQVVTNKQHSLIFFPIDNEDGCGIIELRQCIEDTTRKSKFISQQVPVRWVHLLDEMLRNSKQTSSSYMPLDKVKMIANEVGIKNNQEVDAALKLYHERGMVVYLTATEILKTTVVIEPQFLVNALSKVIRDESLHKFDEEEFEEVGLLNDLRETFENALASRDFLEYVWGEHVDFFTDFMQHTMLLSEWNFRIEPYYLIPSLLRNKSHYEKTGIECRFDFSDNFLPDGVFQRLVCICISSYVARKRNFAEEDVKTPVLYQNLAMIEYDPGNLIHLLETKDTQTIHVFVQNNNLAARTFMMIQSMLRKLNYDIMGEGLTWESFVEDSKGDFVRYDEAREKRILPWFPTETLKPSLPTSNVNVDLATFLNSDF